MTKQLVELGEQIKSIKKSIRAYRRTIQAYHTKIRELRKGLRSKIHKKNKLLEKRRVVLHGGRRPGAGRPRTIPHVPELAKHCYCADCRKAKG
jgi:hypothetical protein